MHGNPADGDLHNLDHYAPAAAFQLSPQCGRIMLICAAFALFFAVVLYQKVYSPSPSNDF
jgi:hypothetical protein